jgi:SAM-dependent methyltransferase
MIRHLRLGHNDVVLDFGAGMCWLSGILSRLGCVPIALDVSETALRLGARALERTPLPPHRPPVAFKLFDGIRMDLPDGSVDRVACFDALHHVPNKTRVLTEMFRVLREGGRACLAEPGPGHSHSEESLRESRQFGVLEDEVDPVETCRLARRVGFSRSYIVPLVEPGSVEWPGEGKPGEALVLDPVATFAVREVLLVLVKGTESSDSRAPSRLLARVEVVDSPQAVEPGREFAARVRVTNLGDTNWLALPERAETLDRERWKRLLPGFRWRPEPLDYRQAFLRKRIRVGEPVHARHVEGYRRFVERNLLEGLVTVGAHLSSADGQAVIDRDYARGFLERDVPPGGQAEVVVRMIAPATPGLFRMEFDPVSEYVAWFEEAGSVPGRDYLRVESESLVRDSRAPGLLRCRLSVVGHPEGRHVTIEATNAGDTIWLAGPLSRPGEVQLGLQAVDADGRVIDRDWRRVPLSRCVWPGHSVTLAVDVGPEIQEGTRRIRLDMVAESVSWFEQQGSRPLELDLSGLSRPAGDEPTRARGA